MPSSVTENVYTGRTLNIYELIHSDLYSLVKFKIKIRNFETRHDLPACISFFHPATGSSGTAKLSTDKMAKKLVSQIKIFRDFVLIQGKSNLNNFHENVKTRPIFFFC